MENLPFGERQIDPSFRRTQVYDVAGIAGVAFGRDGQFDPFVGQFLVGLADVLGLRFLSVPSALPGQQAVALCD
jgi:hypothetical protein